MAHNHNPTTPTCSATTKQGHPCPTGARPSGLCHVHDPAVQCRATKKNGQPCTIATGGGRCKQHATAGTDRLGSLFPW
jgi:ribonuclease HI